MKIPPLPLKTRFLVIFCTCFTLSLICGMFLFGGLRLLERGNSPLSYVYGVRMYPDQHPIQYLSVVSFSFALSATIWTRRVRRFSKIKVGVQIFFVIILSLIFSSYLCGILGIIHDMQAGYFPPLSRAIDDLGQGGVAGLIIGPLMIILSFPLNILAYIVAYYVARFAVILDAPD